MQQSFLDTYAARQPVHRIGLDWRRAAVAPLYAQAWPEVLDDAAGASPEQASGELVLCPSATLEEEACCGAQTVLDWLQSGCMNVAIVVQDRVVARRIRALLERAEVYVADETGWKLSTTRSAASLAALLEVVSARGDTVALLDLLKSPFVFAQQADKADTLMQVERLLRRFNVLGGWNAAKAALEREPAAANMIALVAEQAETLAGRKRLSDWVHATLAALDALEMRDALSADEAGVQVIALLDLLADECEDIEHAFSFAEWRAFVQLRLESAPFVPATLDRRVVMLPLASAALRTFDAVLLVGADADHLPSRATETLFFANAVRRELGLATREQRQREQLRQLIALLSANPRVLLSWQSQRDGEPNPVSGWIERLQLVLERAGAAPLPEHRAPMPTQTLQACLPHQPAPSAPQLLPHRLSASAYNTLVACPYQFFATRMLGLASLDELSDLPEKRDYGDWLHQILKTYHETLRDRAIDAGDREALLRQISEDVFGRVLQQSAAALGYYARWQKTIPAYLEWAQAREAAGWQFVHGEQVLQRELRWEDGGITLHGCIDRIDENGDGERAVLDYKTRNVLALRNRLKEGEDHQLAFYGLLTEGSASRAHYVALEMSRERTGDAEAAAFESWQQMLEQRVLDSVMRIAQGAPLPASGIERVCGFCEVRGLCRKGAW